MSEFTTFLGTVEDIKLAVTPTPAVDPKPETGAAKAPRTDWLDLPRDIRLQRFVASDRAVTYMGQYINRKATANEAHCRLYRIKVRPLPHCESGWGVTIFEDNRRVWSADANTSRYCAEYTAIKMLKMFLKIKCRNADKRRRKREAAKESEAVNG